MSGVRFTHVDLLRGLCAIAVLLAHFAFFFAHTDATLSGTVGSPPGIAVLRPIYEHGGLAVQMFWMLSGFVFLVAYGEEGRRVSMRRFAAWRFSRLYPLHLATFILIAGLQLISRQLLGNDQIYRVNDLKNAVYHLLFVSGWLGASQDSYNAVIWSVSVEVITYALFLTYLKFARPTLLKSVSVGVVSAIAAKIADSVVLECASLFFIGCALAAVLDLLRTRYTDHAVHLVFAAALLAAAGIWALGAAGHTGYALFAFKYAGFAAMLLCAAIADVRRPPIPRRMRWIGDITYAVYLTHMPLMVALLIIGKWNGWSEQVIQGSVVLCSYFAAVIAISWITYHKFELPAQQFLRRRLVPDRREPEVRELSRTI